MKTNWYRLIRLVYTIHFVPLVLGYIKHVRKMVLCCLFTALYCRVSIDDFEYVSKCCQFRFMDWQLAAAYNFLLFCKVYWLNAYLQHNFIEYHLKCMSNLSFDFKIIILSFVSTTYCSRYNCNHNNNNLNVITVRWNKEVTEQLLAI